MGFEIFLNRNKYKINSHKFKLVVLEPILRVLTVYTLFNL